MHDTPINPTSRFKRAAGEAAKLEKKRYYDRNAASLAHNHFLKNMIILAREQLLHEQISDIIDGKYSNHVYLVPPFSKFNVNSKKIN